MVEQSAWSLFYQTLNRLGPRLIEGVHPDLQDWIDLQARDSDDFYSGSLEAEFEAWNEGSPQEVVENALEVWVHNVQHHLRGILGPDSLLPFEQMGITNRKRNQWIA